MKLHTKHMLCLLVSCTAALTSSPTWCMQHAAIRTQGSLVHTLHLASKKCINPRTMNMVIFLSIYAVIWTPIIHDISKKIVDQTLTALCAIEKKRQNRRQEKKSHALLEVLASKPKNQTINLTDLHHEIEQYLKINYQQKTDAQKKYFLDLFTHYADSIIELRVYYPFIALGTCMPLLATRAVLEAWDSEDNPEEPEEPEDTMPRWLFPTLHIATLLLAVANNVMNE